MAVGAGWSGYLAIGTAGAETDISAYVSKCTPTLPTDKADTSVYGAFKSSVPGQYEYTVAFSGPFSPAAHAILQPLRNVLGKGIKVGPQGSTGGNYKQTATGWLEYNAAADVSVTGAVMYSAVFHGTSALSEGVF